MSNYFETKLLFPLFFYVQFFFLSQLGFVCCKVFTFEPSCISTTLLRERRNVYVGRSRALFSALVALVESILRCCKSISSASVARLDSTVHDLCNWTEVHRNCITTNWSVLCSFVVNQNWLHCNDI